MKGLIVPALIAILAFSIPGSAAADSTGKATGMVEWFAGPLDSTLKVATFDAHGVDLNDPKGPKGTFTVDNYEVTYDAEGNPTIGDLYFTSVTQVTCFFSDGNTAVFSGPSSPEGRVRSITVLDAGSPGSGGDQIATKWVDPEPAHGTDCGGPILNIHNVVAGNLTVHQED